MFNSFLVFGLNEIFNRKGLLFHLYLYKGDKRGCTEIDHTFIRVDSMPDAFLRAMSLRKKLGYYWMYMSYTRLENPQEYFGVNNVA